MDVSKIPKHKVELHVHLDGSARIPTLWEIAKQKGFKLSFKTEEEFEAACKVSSPSTLSGFLQPFNIFMPIIVGDVQALERISYEFCEDAAKESILYVEIRYSPHLLSTVEVTAKDVVTAVNRGLVRGIQEFGVKVRNILSCIRGRPEWSEEVLNLCEEFKDKGIVGIDLCGDQNTVMDTTQQDIAVFQKAASKCIHRTIHAGEDGPASQVLLSVRDMYAERIGHGYHVVDNQDIYEECLQKGIHFEACPFSSILTGSVRLNMQKHPIVRFAEDNSNFSISRDDPTIIQRSLEENYNFLRGFGFNDVHFIRANFNAARSSFLPEIEKVELLQQLKNIYGIEKN